jgi:hypothetical protein
MVTKYQLNLGLISENKKSIIFFGQKLAIPAILTREKEPWA